MRFRNLLALRATLALATSASLWATTYYVDPAGSDANSGTTIATPWQTLAKVNSVTFAPGDQILFKAGGTWSGQLQPLGSGASGSPIVIDLYGAGAKPIIIGPGTNASAGVLLTNQAYWEINRLEVTNSQPTGGSNQLTGIRLTNSGATVQHLYVRNCYVHDVNSAPFGDPNYLKGTGGIIFTGAMSDVLCEANHVANVQVEGARTSGATGSANVVFRDNFIENVYGDGIVINTSSGGSLIEYNTIYNACMTNAANFAGAWTYATTGTKIQFNEVAGQTNGLNDGEAFDADISTNGDIFQYNYSHDNKGGFMLFMPSAQNITVRYNLSENDGNGAEIFHYTDNRYATNPIYNNTFYIGAGRSTTFFGGQGVTSTAVYNFQNNIVKVDGTVTQFAGAPVSSGSTFKNNVFFPAAITSVNGPAGTVSGNLNVDPVFIAAGTGGTGMAIGANGFASGQSGYLLQPSSPALGAGVLLSGNGGFDYWGNAVSATAAPNIGAYNGPGQAGFTLSASPALRQVLPGATTTYTVSINGQTGFTGSVALAVAGLPSGASASFSPASVAGSGSSTLSVMTGTATPVGNYTLTATGTSGNLAQSITTTLGVGSTLTLNPTADAYVRNGTYAATNFGAATTMTVKADATGYFRKAYVKFDISAAGSVGTAMLKLYVAAVNTSASRTISVYAVPTTTWGETTLTWNNAPAAGSLLGSFAVSNTAGVWYSFDVSSFVQAQKAAGNGTISLLLINDGAFSSTNDVQFATKEAATGKPQLVITP